MFEGDSGWILLSFGGLIGIIISVFFAWSLHKILRLVPEEYHIFPAWFVWLMVVPLISYIFQWLMLPFGVPQALQNEFEGNENAVRDAKRLFSLGLAFVILVALGFIPIFGFLLAIAAFVVWIIYWFQVVDFRRTYLDK